MSGCDCDSSYGNWYSKLSDLALCRVFVVTGCRESASVDRIKERHRTLLRLNHPDTGGSTFVASKINEAKDVLLRPSSAGRTE